MADDPVSVPNQPSDNALAVRLTFSYRSDEIEFVAAQRVAMFVPPSDPLEDRTSRSGFWLELRDGAGGLIFRQGMHHAMARDYEVFPSDLRGEIVRQPVQERAGAFSVVIPQLHDARTLNFVASPSAVETRCEAATEIASFDMAAMMYAAEGDGEA